MAAPGSSATPVARRPVAGEIIVDFADTPGQLIKSKMEDQVLAIERRKIEREKAKSAEKVSVALNGKEGAGEGLKAEDVLEIVKELSVSRAQAEQALTASKGDLEKALGELIWPSADVGKIGWRSRV